MSHLDNRQYHADLTAMSRSAAHAHRTLGTVRPAPTQPRSRADSAPEHSEHHGRPPSRPDGPKPQSAPEKRKERGRKKCPSKGAPGKKVSIINYNRDTGKVKTHCRGKPKT